jgi:superfamily I DNA/RNA helicase
MDHKAERTNDVTKIVNSTRPRKVVVAGPGTGKSHLFTELIRKKRKQGKTKFLAITFVGKLGDALADDLCGLSSIETMHSFARALVLAHNKTWDYYPRIKELITADLIAEGLGNFAVGDANYRNKTEFYQAVGDGDVVHYAVQMCKENAMKIPRFDLLLVDEYQDFNKEESELIDLLAQHNETVIVGDDDQALYEFKGSSPAFIRNKHAIDNKDWESFNLRFCSRCTEVIVKYFHALVKHFALSNKTETDVGKRRIDKEYLCFLTGKGDGKDEDSQANPKIHLLNNCPMGMVAHKVKFELQKLVKTQKIKEVLILGEAQTCAALLKSIASQLENYGFKNIVYANEKENLPIRPQIVDAYRRIARDSSSVLGWRILGNPSVADKEKHLSNAKTLIRFIEGTPSELEKIKRERVISLEGAIEDWSSQELKSGKDSESDKRHIQNEAVRKCVLVRELKRANVHLPRPLGNLDITVCSILRSKGLGADIVFLVGFDKGKFPKKSDATEAEIYQMLVAITRAKKRIYLINTTKGEASGFLDCLRPEDLEVENIK